MAAIYFMRFRSVRHKDAHKSHRVYRAVISFAAVINPLSKARDPLIEEDPEERARQEKDEDAERGDGDRARVAVKPQLDEEHHGRDPRGRGRSQEAEDEAGGARVAATQDEREEEDAERVTQADKDPGGDEKVFVRSFGGIGGRESIVFRPEEPFLWP